MLSSLFCLIICIITIHIFKFQLYLFIIFNRGIITPNEFWWNIHDLFINKHDLINFVLSYDNNNINLNKNILGYDVTIVNNIIDLKFILDNSPKRYKRGTIKYNYLKKMMEHNIGIVYDTEEWKYLRQQNEYVLSTRYIKSNIIIHLEDKIKIECNKIDYYDTIDKFINLSKNITKLVLFGHINVSDDLFLVIDTPNYFNINKDNKNNHYDILRNIIRNTEIDDMSLLGKFINILDNLDDRSLDQIPHWIFPIYNAIILTLPRLIKIDSYYNGDVSIRNKILEIVRLYNQVITLFRLDSETNKEYLIFIQMFLRNSKYFDNPHSYRPERWNDKNLEHQYYSLMFSMGPQICPGKNIIIQILEILFLSIKDKFYSPKNLNINDLPDSLNPLKFMIE
jgi:hypothetical protein